MEYKEKIELVDFYSLPDFGKEMVVIEYIDSLSTQKKLELSSLILKKVFPAKKETLIAEDGFCVLGKEVVEEAFQQMD